MALLYIGSVRCLSRTIVACAAFLLLAPSAHGGVTIGSDLKPAVPDGGIVNATCAVGPCTSINSDFSPAAQQTSLIDGVIVRWRLRQGSNTAGSGALRVVHAVTLPSEWTGVRTGPGVSLPAAAGSYLFDARLPISAGDAIGLNHGVDHGVIVVASAGRDSLFNGTLLDGTTRTEDGAAAGEVLLNADIELDADRDGFGDETQDSCPVDATRQTPCKPKIEKGPRRKTASRKARFRFSSGGPGATFECALDKRKFKSCSSPKKLKVGLGKHRFQVRGMDSAGQLSEPAVFKWRVVA